MLDRLRPALMPYAMLPVRLGLGLSLAVHGLSHAAAPDALARSLSRADLPLADTLAWLVAGIELLGGLLVLVGFQVRGTAAALCLWLAVDTFVLRWRSGYFASDGGFELPLLLLLAALGLVLGGAGRASVDSIRGAS